MHGPHVSGVSRAADRPARRWISLLTEAGLSTRERFLPGWETLRF